ncbi:MAG: 30S ribosomal protein S2 [Candidatus ainarchaeum sp.]|nr:30S ribosomal protein S2 [Candidatus ainarchaeum sp.]
MERNKITEKKEKFNQETETKSENRSPQTQRTLVNVDLYLKNGIHIGTKYKNGAMRKFIFKSRPDKINVMDVQHIDKRIKLVIDFINRYDPQDVVFVSRKKYSLPGLKILEQNFGYKVKLNRFIPGTFTNPESEHFIEPKLVFISDPNVDRQAIVESAKIGVPIIALCTTSSNIRNIDYVVPYNNKGRKSVALFFWLLVRELQLRHGIIKSEKEYIYGVEDLVYNQESGEKSERDSDDDLGGSRKRGRVSRRPPLSKPVTRPRTPRTPRAPMTSAPSTAKPAEKTDAVKPAEKVDVKKTTEEKKE